MLQNFRPYGEYNEEEVKTEILRYLGGPECCVGLTEQNLHEILYQEFATSVGDAGLNWLRLSGYVLRYTK